MPNLEIRAVKRYGWSPSLPDLRDLIADTAELGVLDEVDPRADLDKPYDQGPLGSCTGNAVGACVDYDAQLNGNPYPTWPSRLMIYYGEREIEGSIEIDAGAYGRDGFKFCKKVGAADETIWTYDISRFTERPSAEAYADGEKRRISAYKAVPRSLDQFKAVLSNRQTIAFGFSVYESFEGPDVAKTGIMPMPQRGERMMGGHEVLLIGYLKDEPNYALVRNSWGTSWGIGGHFLMPWSVLLDSNMSSDFRTIPRPKGK